MHPRRGKRRVKRRRRPTFSAVGRFPAASGKLLESQARAEWFRTSARLRMQWPSRTETDVRHAGSHEGISLLGREAKVRWSVAERGIALDGAALDPRRRGPGTTAAARRVLRRRRQLVSLPRRLRPELPAGDVLPARRRLRLRPEPSGVRLCPAGLRPQRVRAGHLRSERRLPGAGLSAASLARRTGRGAQLPHRRAARASFPSDGSARAAAAGDRPRATQGAASHRSAAQLVARKAGPYAGRRARGRGGRGHRGLRRRCDGSRACHASDARGGAGGRCCDARGDKNGRAGGPHRGAGNAGHRSARIRQRGRRAED